MFCHMCSGNLFQVTFNGEKLDFELEGYALILDWLRLTA